MPGSVTRVALRRPVGTAALSLLVLGLAFVSYLRLPVALLPDLQFPALAVWTAFPDALPERVERSLTETIEEAVSGTPGLHRLTSQSQPGGSLVRLELDWGTQLDLALFTVREQLDRLGDSLPDGAERPVVLRLDPSSRPILWITLSAEPSFLGSGSSDEDLTEIAREVIARRLEQIPGVARTAVAGGRQELIEIEVDPSRLTAYGLTLEDISEAVQAANVSLVGGLVRVGSLQQTLEISGEYRSAREVGDTVIASGSDGLIRLRDVGTIRQAAAPRRGQVRLSGRDVLLLMVERRPESNTVTTSDQVRASLRELERQFPGIRLDVVVDESVFIRHSIRGVLRSAILGGLLAVIVLMVFVRRPVTVLALVSAIPLSLALTVVLFDAFDITFNLVSLGGLALGLGLLVDNAIIVVENISRRIEEGSPPQDAAEQGTTEVVRAITASTFTTIVVFAPLSFVEGLAGRLFRDQSLAVVCSLLASLLVAITVVPVLVSRGAGLAGAGKRASLGSRNLWGRIYERLLNLGLRHPGRVVLILGLYLAGTLWLGARLPREILPRTDQGRIETHIALPSGTDFDTLENSSAELEQRLLHLPGVAQVLADLGERDDGRLDFDPRPSYEGDLTLVLDASTSTSEVQRRVLNLLAASGLRGSARPAPTRLESLLRPDQADLQLDFVSARRRDAESAVDGVLSDLASLPELANVERDRPGTTSVVRLLLDRVAIERLGVSVSELTAFLESTARGWQISALRTVNQDIPVLVRAPTRGSLDSFLQQRISTALGPYPLAKFVRAEREEVDTVLLRVDQRPVVRATADIASGSDLRGAVDAVRERIAPRLPVGIRLEVRGTNDAFLSSLRAMGISLLLSVTLVYLILAAQFESLLQPLVILSTVPLAAGGVALSLAITRTTVNLMSLTGCVVLVGIVVNDAIVKVDFINQERRRGTPLGAAIRLAGQARLRPILMTTLTTVLALFPLALRWGTGAELQAPLAITLIGGLSSATALTLFVIPVLYLLIARLERR